MNASKLSVRLAAFGADHHHALLPSLHPDTDLSVSLLEERQSGKVAFRHVRDVQGDDAFAGRPEGALGQGVPCLQEVRLHAPRETGAQQRPEGGIGGLMREDATDPPALQELARHPHLRGLSAAVRALEYDKFSSVRHNICIIPFQREFVNPRTDAALLAPRKSASFYVVLRIERRPPRGFRAAGAVSNVRFKFNYAHRRRR